VVFAIVLFVAGLSMAMRSEPSQVAIVPVGLVTLIAAAVALSTRPIASSEASFSPWPRIRLRR
jgi:hypothetical protein